MDVQAVQSQSQIYPEALLNLEALILVAGKEELEEIRLGVYFSSV